MHAPTVRSYINRIRRNVPWGCTMWMKQPRKACRKGPTTMGLSDPERRTGGMRHRRAPSQRCTAARLTHDTGSVEGRRCTILLFSHTSIQIAGARDKLLFVLAPLLPSCGALAPLRSLRLSGRWFVVAVLEESTRAFLDYCPPCRCFPSRTAEATTGMGVVVSSSSSKRWRGETNP